jgi:hypothetical protein
MSFSAAAAIRPTTRPLRYRLHQGGLQEGLVKLFATPCITWEPHNLGAARI